MLITLVTRSSGISVFVMSFWCTGWVTSRTMCRSSKLQTRLSMVTGTEPSSAFSMATMPSGTSPDCTARSTSGMEG